MFSSRLPPRLAANPFSQELARLRAEGTRLVDLTTTNPTAVGISYPPTLLSALADRAALRYTPEPLGIPSARAAVAAWESTRGTRVNPDQIVLTASTSEAYAALFKLLCDAGDRVLVPEPSYPLFDLLTRLDSVTAAPYQLEDHGVWSIDRASLEAAAGARTRAVLVVSPNNPTGSRLRADDHEWLVDFAQRRNLALISDEVFTDYPLLPRPDASTLLGESRVLTFTLGGLSKTIGLPQAKLGWMVVSGPAKHVADAMARLEVICDTYLSVSTPVQVAAGHLLEAGEAVRNAIRARIAANLEALRLEAMRHPGIRVVEPEGGWACVLQVPSRGDEESLVLLLLRDQHLVVHPGYFFDFHRGAHLVVSLLPEPRVFTEAIARVMEVAE